MEKDPLLIQYTLRIQYPPALQVHEIIGEDSGGITGRGRKGPRCEATSLGPWQENYDLGKQDEQLMHCSPTAVGNVFSAPFKEDLTGIWWRLILTQLHRLCQGCQKRLTGILKPSEHRGWWGLPIVNEQDIEAICRCLSQKGTGWGRKFREW